MIFKLCRKKAQPQKLSTSNLTPRAIASVVRLHRPHRIPQPSAPLVQCRLASIPTRYSGCYAFASRPPKLAPERRCRESSVCRKRPKTQCDTKARTDRACGWIRYDTYVKRTWFLVLWPFCGVLIWRGACNSMTLEKRVRVVIFVYHMLCDVKFTFL